ncbi:hypothetical protein [Actinomadura xylanilytica]|uniref:hypothetical protein n=1 Tax=Actinomadura xylanilytica TaxID=887459 RepID=UPI00255B296A|nr:hypothetical protein [Actinomadura xylanilytica]MDL4777451.1 hypothetical protein [Actinomadura xylanilytica]
MLTPPHPFTGRIHTEVRAGMAMEPGEARAERLERLVARAEADGGPYALIDTRVAYLYARCHPFGRPEDALAALAPCLELYRAAPERFGEWHRDRFWESFRRLTLTMLVGPGQRASWLRAVVDDLRFCRRPGHRTDMEDVHLAELLLEWRVGNVAAAEEAIRLILACGPREGNQWGRVGALAGFLADLGRDAEAIESLEPALTGSVPVREDGDPARFADHLLLPYLRTGRAEEAGALHARTWRGRLTGFRLASHLEFCARTGNEERGREILHRHLEPLADDLGSILRIREYAAAALLCRRLAESGRWDDPWTWPEDNGTAGGDIGGDGETWTYAELHEEFRDDVLSLADHMADSDGTACIRERMGALMDAGPIVAHLPLP